MDITEITKSNIEPLTSYRDLLTVEDMVEVLGVSDRTVYRMVERNELPAVKVGRRLYFPRCRLVELFGIAEVAHA